MKKGGLALGVLLLFSIAKGQSLSEAALFNRCYSHLTGRPVPLGNAQMAQVKAGTLKAIDACSGILDKADLDASGPLVNRYDPEARSVLSNFNSFHRSWFTANTVEQIQDYNNEISIGTTDVYDSTEPALAITRAVFMRGARYSEALTSDVGVHAIREQSESVRAQIGWAVNFPGRRFYGNNFNFDQNLFNFRGFGIFTGANDASFVMAMPKIEVGELVGVRRTSESFVVPNLSLEPLGGDFRGSDQPGLDYTYNFYQTLGGGILGTPIYILLNYGQTRNVRSNGALKMPRRWAQTNMQSFMCASLPALRESDVAQYVVGNSTTPFRNATSCVMCHANLDQMAGTIRNTVMGNSDFAQLSGAGVGLSKTTLLLPLYKADLGAVAGWPSEPVANYHRTAPTGKLFFRSMTGELVNRPVNNVAELGQAMAETKDLYYCAAKRYFEYFTGISVAMYDRTNPANAHLNSTLSEEAVKDRKFIEALGEELRSTQSIRLMMKKIMSSDYYRATNFRAK
jgi:hypothetical protein